MRTSSDNTTLAEFESSALMTAIGQSFNDQGIPLPVAEEVWASCSRWRTPALRRYALTRGQFPSAPRLWLLLRQSVRGDRVVTMRSIVLTP